MCLVTGVPQNTASCPASLWGKIKTYHCLGVHVTQMPSTLQVDDMRSAEVVVTELYSREEERKRDGVDAAAKNVTDARKTHDEHDSLQSQEPLRNKVTR